MELNSGDIYSIKTNIGYGFLQYVETDEMGIEFIRVLEPINRYEEISQLEVNKTERWNIGFCLKATAKKKIINKIGNFDIPKSFKNPKYARREHVIGDDFLGWHIVNKTTLKTEFKKNLTKKDLKLSPHGIMNDTLIIERLENNWRLENWKKD